MPTHLALGSSVGISDDELSWLGDWRAAPLFDSTDRLVLEYADSLTRDVRVDDALWDALQVRFSQTEIFELCFSVGVAALVNRVHATFLTDVDERTQARVESLSLPEGSLPKPRH